MMQPTEINSPLVYLNLAAHAGKVHIKEDPLVSELNLRHCSDDPQLLKALGTISGSNRPLAPRQITRFGPLLILWISSDEWLVLPAKQHGHDLEQALYSAFDEGITLELIPDGSFQALLSDAARQQVISAENRAITASGIHGSLNPRESICIRPWATLSNYDLVLSQQDLELLRNWLNRLQH
ncbi:MAG: hypothetical protein V7739_16680 [Motiliproteus sp.]